MTCSVAKKKKKKERNDRFKPNWREKESHAGRKTQRHSQAGCVQGTLASLIVVSEVCLKRVR